MGCHNAHSSSPWLDTSPICQQWPWGGSAVSVQVKNVNSDPTYWSIQNPQFENKTTSYYDTLHADLQNRNCETSKNPKSFSSRNCSIWPLCPAIEMISFDGSYNSFEKLLHVGNCLSIATANMYHPPTLWAVTFEHFLSAIKEWGYVWQPNYYTVISPHTKLNIYSLNCRDESPITIL